MAEYIAEANVNLTEGNLPTFYKYRYTFHKTEQDLGDQKTKFRLIYNFIKSHYLIGDKIVGGIEHYTKGMIKTKPHIHIHFVSKSKADTIRKGLMREYDMIGRCQSCKAEVCVDESKFWRYPLKQQSGETKIGVLISGFSQEEAKNMVEVAYACWKMSAEIAIGKVEKKLERSSKDRLFAYLDTQSYFEEINKGLVSLKQSYIIGYKYYVENEDTFCVKTVEGYINSYLLQKNLISYEEFYELIHK